MAETLVVVSKIKKTVKEAGFRTGGDYIDALSSRVDSLVQASISKVKADGSKKTLGAEDLQ
ncbi:MAG: hypothetical protein A2992_05905 [Elusimicrobia bacterium RIFCSPLOWO2_01_FULL_59_12]|nr:MAG: hypothetical protein A2992_05905 [Elusimicrobia bacterium RIFCSPLOWO2_01_FULL_59_12]